MTKYIALSGDYGAGKTTSANNLTLELPNAIRLALGDRVRESLHKDLSPTFQINKQDLYSKPTPDYIRNLIKGYAEAKKYLSSPPNKYIWIQELLDISFSLQKDVVVIDDMRFAYDFSYLTKKVGRDNVLLLYVGELEIMYDLMHFYTSSDRQLPKRDSKAVIDAVKEWLWR